MATPPRITAAERDAALARIARRHARIDDVRRSELGSEPRDVIAYVLGRGPAGVPRWVAAADHADALVLMTWCWWADRRTERRLLRQGRHLGLSLAELGAPLGITSRQGVQDRLDRLDALLEYDRPDEQLTRTARREARNRDARQVWIDRNRDAVRAVLAGLLAQAHRLLDTDLPDTDLPAAPDGHRPRADTNGHLPGAGPGAGDWLDELAADYDSDALSPATLAVAGLVAAELRTTPAVLALDPRHRLHTALREVEALRARYAGAV
ncbi:hypothetical protein ACVGVM_29315 (plasmid) [Pseudonocardia bannensis]|uniref:Uncharacterized protein n=1 Tax=Pseudonocardia bannensis TaxID=630973 RepID=A0A848DNH0_9PSEU|nr:hypothetical protein [Pseudonocardia bannensis]NMH94360.1 hypothetical protein [Pseudonocardia bannensis]